MLFSMVNWWCVWLLIGQLSYANYRNSPLVKYNVWRVIIPYLFLLSVNTVICTFVYIVFKYAGQIPVSNGFMIPIMIVGYFVTFYGILAVEAKIGHGIKYLLTRVHKHSVKAK